MKNFFLFPALLIGFFLQAQEETQKREIFNIAIRGGLNSASFSSVESDSKTAFYLGISLPLEFTRFYTLNPEINYSAQGAKNVVYEGYNNQGNHEIIKKDIDANYISLNIINRFTAKNVFIEFGPGLDFLDKTKDYNYNGVDLTFNLGVGFNISNKITIQGRLKKGVISAIDSYQVNNNYYYSENGYNHVLSLGVQYKL
nr:outer membrane beta-barrel protein [uncultured Flavobacterium sp.]